MSIGPVPWGPGGWSEEWRVGVGVADDAKASNKETLFFSLHLGGLSHMYH